MKIFLGLLTLMLLISTVGTPAVAQSYQRVINLEWEATEGASGYEIEITSNTDPTQKPISVKAKTSEWSGKIAPGNYNMRLRAFDYRNVPGEWSDKNEFAVHLDNVYLNSPKNLQIINSKENKKDSVKFSWSPVNGAQDYLFSVLDESGNTIHEKRITENSLELDLNTAAKYTWKVTAFSASGISSEATSINSFELWGPKIDAPKIESPESNFVRELNWTAPNYSNTYDISLSKLNPTTKKWEKFKRLKDYTSTKVDFLSDWDGGTYQLLVKAKSPYRIDSAISKINFDVRSGNRSPAAEYTALVRKSIERIQGWYGIASYLVTQMHYSGTNPENASSVSYNAIGGTGRIGLGWYLPESTWGFLGIVDMSGFTINNKTHTFASAESNAVYKNVIGERGEIRIQLGGFYKEIPETIGDPFTSSSTSTTVKSLGPHVGVEYWHSLSPKFGIQANAHGYLSMVKISTPNSQPINTTFSTQFGLLGSYRFNSRFTGLVGFARREDRVSYKSKVSSSTFAVSGDVNTATIVGNYLNFFAEYNF